MNEHVHPVFRGVLGSFKGTPMSEKKHTPGPWMVAPSFTHHAANYISASINGSSPVHVGGTYDIPDFAGNQEANTRLIAAAPELLEALKDVVNYFWGTESPVLSEGDVHDLVKAAISKAEGRS